VRCELIQPHLAAYVDGELEDALRLDVEKHLEECRGCRETVLDMRLASAVLKKWKPAQPTMPMVEVLRKRIREEEIARHTAGPEETERVHVAAGRSALFGARRLALAASILLALGVGIVTWEWLTVSRKPTRADAVAALGRAAMKVDKVEDLRAAGLALHGVIADHWASPKPNVDALVQLEVVGTMMQTASEVGQASDVGKILNILGEERVVMRLREEIKEFGDGTGECVAALLAPDSAAADEPSGEDNTLLDEAAKLEDRGELEAALEKYREASRDRLLAMHSFLHQAALEMRLGRDGEAVETLKKAQELTKPDTFNRELVNQLSQRAEHAAELRSQIDELKAKLLRTENEFEVLSEIGNLQVKAGNLKGAKETCEEIIREFGDPGHRRGQLRARLLKAWCLREMNQYASAFDELEPLITDAADAYPDLAMLAQYERAKTFQLRGRFAQAVDDYTELANTPGISPSCYAALEFQVAYIFLHDLNSPREANKIFRQLGREAYREEPFGRLAAQLVSNP